MNDPIRFFAEEKWTAAVVGLGYVGLPLVVTASQSGLGASGFDVSESIISRLALGRSHIDDVSDEDLAASIKEGSRFSSDPEILAGADAIFICVPSPLGRDREPDLSYIESAAETIGSVIRAGQLICLESTTYPGTTEDFLLPIVEKAGLEIDRDVWVAFSPERVSPGDDMKTADIPKVVGGVTPLSGQVAEAAYQRLVPSVHVVSSARAAEMTKLLENTYRAVNIGLVNEVAQLSHELDIDIWEVVDAAATKPFGFQAFYPGPGIGGHCIPLDPHYLAWRARKEDFDTRFIATAEDVNAGMPAYTTRRISDLLTERGSDLVGASILVIGLAYKPDVSDDRESASVEVAQLLKSAGVRVSVLDPHVDEERIRAHGFDVVSGDSDLSGFELATVLTDHAEVDYQRVAEDVPVVFDTRGIYRRLGLEVSNVQTL